MNIYVTTVAHHLVSVLALLGVFNDLTAVAVAVIIVSRVDASQVMSQPVLWIIHTNKCGRVQLLLGHYTVPYEIYHLINCPFYLI